jgi:hypothetical protein
MNAENTVPGGEVSFVGEPPSQVVNVSSPWDISGEGFVSQDAVLALFDGKASSNIVPTVTTNYAFTTKLDDYVPTGTIENMLVPSSLPATVTVNSTGTWSLSHRGESDTTPALTVRNGLHARWEGKLGTVPTWPQKMLKTTMDHVSHEKAYLYAKHSSSVVIPGSTFTALDFDTIYSQGNLVPNGQLGNNDIIQANDTNNRLFVNNTGQTRGYWVRVSTALSAGVTNYRAMILICTSSMQLDDGSNPGYTYTPPTNTTIRVMEKQLPFHLVVPESTDSIFDKSFPVTLDPGEGFYIFVYFSGSGATIGSNVDKSIGQTTISIHEL